MLPRGPHDSRTFPTATGKALFTVNPPDSVEVPDGHLLLQTVRSHDQFNTTVYGLNDRYRGINGGRRVVFVNPDDLRDRGLRALLQEVRLRLHLLGGHGHVGSPGER